MRRSKIAAGALMLMSTAGLTMVSAPAAHAASCGPERHLASAPTKLHAQLGPLDETIGYLYIGYIPSCRMEYAELHLDPGVTYTSDVTVWVQDGNGHRAGQIDHGGTWNDNNGGNFFSSALVPIDGFGYTFSQPWVHLGITQTGTGLAGVSIPNCRPTDFRGNYHDFANGYNQTDHGAQGCGFG